MDRQLKRLKTALDRLKAFGATGDAASILEEAYEATAEIEGSVEALRASVKELQDASREIEGLVTN